MIRQHLQHPAKDLPVRLDVDQSARSRYCGVIRSGFRQPVPQKPLQTQRVRTTPCDASLRVDAFEVPDQQHSEIYARCDARPPHRLAFVKTNALFLRELIKPRHVQNLIYPIVKNVTPAAWQLVRGDPQILLPRSFLSHRHSLLLRRYLSRSLDGTGPTTLYLS